ncbi:putative membrane protein [Candidatus Phytoplasma solani]
MELFKLLVIIGILGIIFLLIPLWIWFIQKRENTNRIKKVNIKTALIVYYVMMSIIVLAFGVFLFLDIKYDITKTKPKIYTIPETKKETHDEWFQAESKSGRDEKGEYKYIPSYRIDYSEEDKEKNKKHKS